MADILHVIYYFYCCTAWDLPFQDQALGKCFLSNKLSQCPGGCRRVRTRQHPNGAHLGDT